MNSCHVVPIEKNVVLTGDEQLETILLLVSGMGCPNCAIRVRNGLLDVQGVISADVDHRAGTAGVLTDRAYVNIASLIDAVTKAGDDGHHCYRATLVIN